MERPSRSERTLAKTQRGGLPATFEGKVGVGPGSATECNGCGERIDPKDREVELDFSGNGSSDGHGSDGHRSG